MIADDRAAHDRRTLDELNQRPDRYVFTDSWLRGAHIAEFLRELFAARPARRAGILARVADYHDF